MNAYVAVLVGLLVGLIVILLGTLVEVGLLVLEVIVGVLLRPTGVLGTGLGGWCWCDLIGLPRIPML